MFVGMMTGFYKPTQLAKYTALMSKSYGIELIYLRPKDVDIEKGTVNGKVFNNSEWIDKEVSIPPFIDIAPYCFKKKNKEITDYLKERTFLSDDRKNVLKKRMLQNRLRKDEKFSHLVIPTYTVRNVKNIQHYLKEYSKVVLKPSGGIKGRGIYVLEKFGEKYLIGHNREEYVLNEDEFVNFFNESIYRKGYILQKHITSRTRQGDPFDCRIHVEKNHEGKWQSAKNYIRVGIGQKVISNVNQGGGIANPEQFLKANFGEQWKSINKELNALAVTLPYKVEKLRGTHIMSLGIDIGIDTDGKLYMFEVNDGPATFSVLAEVAYLRSNYYNYILRNKLHLYPKKNVPHDKYEAAVKEKDNYKKSVSTIQQERDKFKKKYIAMMESTSWKWSAPIRKLGDIRRKLQPKK